MVQDIPVSDIWEKVMLPDLCQLEKGVVLPKETNGENRGAGDPAVGSLLMVLMDHMELVQLAKLPGTPIYKNFLR